MTLNNVHVFGIRHHGPGSARSLVAALEALQPDAILVEGPPDGDSMLPLLTHAQMQPPVALLIYAPEQPKLAVYYPFAVFSPEWQALRFGLMRGIPTHFMDLPQTHRLALSGEAPNESSRPEERSGEAESIHTDPLRWLAEAAGYSDGERWWEHMVEQRRGSDSEVFTAILEAMTALREAAPPPSDSLEVLREAAMRQIVRKAQRAGHRRIAVVCGAWHAPALAALAPVSRTDADLIKALPRLKVEATWIPWTYGRLTFSSGYGAGVESPGWYQHLWETHDDVIPRWMTHAARLLRSEGLNASPAQIIDSVRLAESLAALRERPLPGLPELNEAARAVFCFGSDVPMSLIWQKLIVGERLGDVPDETPAVPLVQDVQREQKRLRLKPDPAPRDLELDLREPTDLARSHLLHRLSLLDIEWGTPRQVSGKGTFKEGWRLKWQPEFVVDLIEASAWGNTLYDAATNYARGAADSAADLAALTGLLEQVLLAALPDAITHLMHCVQEKAALSGDVGGLMDALPPLARVARYSDVRQTDTAVVIHVLDGLAARICIGLPGACASLDDDAAAHMFQRLIAVNNALTLLQNAEHIRLWQAALRQVADREGVHGLIAGRCTRLLHDAGEFTPGESARRLGLALAPVGEPAQAAAWIEGFLSGSGQILLHDETLWAVIDDWLSGLREEAFTALLPLVRRTFATFTPSERRMMGERARHGQRKPDTAVQHFDTQRAAAVLPLLRQLLGVKTQGSDG